MNSQKKVVNHLKKDDKYLDRATSNGQRQQPFNEPKSIEDENERWKHFQMEKSFRTAII